MIITKIIDPYEAIFTYVLKVIENPNWKAKNLQKKNWCENLIEWLMGCLRESNDFLKFSWTFRHILRARKTSLISFHKSNSGFTHTYVQIYFKA